MILLIDTTKAWVLLMKYLVLLKRFLLGTTISPTAMLFRNSKLVSSILCSIETVYGLTAAHIEQLEQCDRLLLRKVFCSVSSTAIEAFYLEANILPFRHIMIARRVIYTKVKMN